MKIRGLKLQMAIQLVAEGNLTEVEIARQIKMRVGDLLELMQDPLFVRRVKEVRCVRLERTFGVPKVVSRAISKPRASRTPAGPPGRT